MNYKVCILCAGQGTRVQIYPGLHKALLPLGNRAAISLVLDAFDPSVPVVVALGYKGNQVRSYLEFFHSNRTFEFVYVDNYDQPGSGPGYSLYRCRSNLQCPFVFTSVDTIVDSKEHDLVPHENWVSIGKVDADSSSEYCLYENGKGFYYGHGQTAFAGMAGIRDYETFWDNLSRPMIIRKEHQVIDGFSTIKSAKTKLFSTWKDTGNRKAYDDAKLSFSEVVEEKPNEVIFIENGKVAKFFSDTKVVDNRVTRASILKGYVPNIVRLDDHMYGYSYVEGKLLSNIVNEKELDSFIDFLSEFLTPHIVSNPKSFRDDCAQMHRNKLFYRIQKSSKIKDIDAITSVNGLTVRPIMKILNDIDWNMIFDNAIPYRFHGDLQPENIIYCNGKFTLIDWRDSFGKSLEIGDIYYDLGKLYHAILVNGHIVRSKQYEVDIQGKNAQVRIDIRSNLVLLMDKFRRLCKYKGYDWNTVTLLGILQYINICSMHYGEYSKFLFLFGKLNLEKLLQGILYE